MTDLFAPGRRDVPSDVQNEVLTAVGARNLKRAMYAMDLKALVNKDNAWRMRQRREVFEQSPTVRKLLEPFTNVPLDFWNWAAYVSEPGSPKLFLWDPMEPGTDYINDEDGMRREITKLGAGVASMSRLFPDVQTWFPRLNETMEGLELHRMSIHIRPGALPRPDLVWCVYRDCVSPMLLGSQQQFAVFDRSHVPYESVVRAYPPRLSRAYTSAHDIVGVYNTHAEAMQNVVWRAEYRRVWPVPRSDGGAYATYNEAIRHPTLITSEITVYYDLVGEGLSVVSQINGLGSMTKEELHALVMSKEPETGPRLPPGDMFKDPYTLNEDKGEEDQSPWCASSDAAVADVCMLHLLLSSLDTHFERAGAGVEIADAALVYLDRTRVPLTRRTSYKLVAVATLLAVKVDDDFSLSNASWAECVDMSLSELNALERAFCASVDWRFYVFTTT